MGYIDGFVIAVPSANKQSSPSTCNIRRAVHRAWRDPCNRWSGDNVPDGKITDFRRAVQATAGKRWPSRGSSGRTGPRETLP